MFNSTDSIVAHHLWYTGRVQGVGFRFTVQRWASERALQGWIKNLEDGRVELFLQGQESLVQEVLDLITTRFVANIQVIHGTTVPASITSESLPFRIVW